MAQKITFTTHSESDIFLENLYGFMEIHLRKLGVNKVTNKTQIFKRMGFLFVSH